MKSHEIRFAVSNEIILVQPTPALYADLDEKAGGLTALAEKIEGGKLRHAELIDIIALLAQGRVHREEIEKSLLEEGAAVYIGHLAQLLAIYFTGMKRITEFISPGEIQARN